jgi:hypothetical protein
MGRIDHSYEIDAKINKAYQYLVSSVILLKSCNPATAETIDFAFPEGHFAKRAQSSNLSTTSLHDIGSAGLPFAKSARPEMVRPSCR